MRLVHKLGAGVNTIDVDTATRLGIAVANMPGANAPSVAEGTVLLMLAALRRLPELDRATREGKGWPSDPSLGETVRDIGGCTVGLVGYGNIAKRVERIVVAMGRRRPAHQHPRRRPSRLAAAARTAGRQRHRLVAPAADRGDRGHAGPCRAGPDEARRGAGQHLPRRGGRRGRTRRCAAHRAAWRPRAWTCSPSNRYRPTIPLLSLANVVLTPHVTWYTVDTMRRYLAVAVDNCRRIRDGRELANVVNGIVVPNRPVNRDNPPATPNEVQQLCPSRSTPEHNDLADSVRSLVARVAPSDVLHEALETPIPNPPPYWKAAAEQGLQGVHLAESVGGQGFGILELAIVLAEFGYGAVPGPFVPSAIASALIAATTPTPSCSTTWPPAR